MTRDRIFRKTTFRKMSSWIKYRSWAIWRVEWPEHTVRFIILGSPSFLTVFKEKQSVFEKLLLPRERERSKT